MDSQNQQVFVAELSEPSPPKKRRWDVWIALGAVVVFVAVAGGALVFGTRYALNEAAEQERQREERLAEVIVEVGGERFDAEVLTAEVPVVVEFYANQRPLCREQAVTLQELAMRGDDVKIAKIDGDANPELCEQYHVEEFPTLLVVKQGELVARQEGLATQEQLDELLAAEIAPPSADESPADRLFRQARRDYLHGDDEQATQLVEQALELDAQHPQALNLHVQLLEAEALDLIRKDSEAALAVFDRAGPSARRLQQLRDLSPAEEMRIATLFYNEACAASLSGEPQRALKCLEEAFEAGFRDLDHYAIDPDLEPLRERPDFQKFMQSARRRRAMRR